MENDGEPEIKIVYRDIKTQNPGTAAVLSAICTGLGQIYNGQIGKGVALMIIQAINILLMFVLIGFVTLPIVWLYGVYDAYQTAMKQ